MGSLSRHLQFNRKKRQENNWTRVWQILLEHERRLLSDDGLLGQVVVVQEDMSDGFRVRQSEVDVSAASQIFPSQLSTVFY